MSPEVSELPAKTNEIATLGQKLIDKKDLALVGVNEKDATSDQKSESDPDTIIITGADAALHLLPLRDGFDSVLTFRSIILASGLACFQAVMNQIYLPTSVTIGGTFIVLISYFIGNAWARFLPRGDRLELRWREKRGLGKLPWWITVMKFVNNGAWSLKEHSICAITATSASNAASSSTVLGTQMLFYDLKLTATTVVLSTISIGLFGYGICGILRPIGVWHTEAVYWGNLPIVKTLQALHWQQLKISKPLRYYWYAFTGKSLYEIIPAYIFPWMNSVSIPISFQYLNNTLGKRPKNEYSMFFAPGMNQFIPAIHLKKKVSAQLSVLKSLLSFHSCENREFSATGLADVDSTVLGCTKGHREHCYCTDQLVRWRQQQRRSRTVQYIFRLAIFEFRNPITPAATAVPLKLQMHMAIGLACCFASMLGIYYGNAWNSRSLLFVSTTLLTAEGKRYPVSKLFPGGVLDESVMAAYGLPRLTGTLAFGMLMANATIGALVVHCILFWGKGIWHSYKSARKGRYDDRHHLHMAAHYKEAPWWWYIIVLVISFVLGIVVIVEENLTLPVWAYAVALSLGIIITPFVSMIQETSLCMILYSRFGTGIATNNLSKMLGGLIVPGRPIGNMYFAAWSHNVVTNGINLASDLKMGEYLKIPPRVMFLTQFHGTMLGAFINYAIMRSILAENRNLLINGNGNSAWSGPSLQAYNTNAAS
ncbi:unnamed protein product [Penicillium nalgiovense]|nr:unnamed protein product [Penicillium nalgiovense]CAG8098819.1 unnamed protein product [Penicillium nalgiovense]CAG8104705.1 unnamed protein product [Penicillium nalgiovense]CAG8105793.1 unnamed protein product [Penicillium nalgiovense]CAG8110137.1 unnamed protein product [Penicillium nalgiovense]